MRRESWTPASKFVGYLLVGMLGVSCALAPAAWAEDAAGGTEATTVGASDSSSSSPTTPAAGDAAAAAPAEAATEAPAAPPAYATLDDMNTLWTCVAAFLVFFMQAGFALVEAGFTRAKNVCNILMKNLMDFAIGTIVFWVVGFGLMFGACASTKGLIGASAFVFSTESSFAWAFLLFQTVFAATAATIISGAMAERTKFKSYLFYTVGITAVVYPVFGCWGWNSLGAGAGVDSGKGWLEGMGFADFAGSTVVHSIGGWAGLAGAMWVGARIGRYGKDGKVNPIPGHNIPLAALGVFILWLGWFGFNPGSTTAVGGGSFAVIAVATNMAGAAGAIAAMITSWILFKKPDPSFTLNGALAGLVAITAGCNVIDPKWAVVVGLAAGALVVFSVLFFDRVGVDDPVGAVSVHGVCGAFGTLAVGLFHKETGLVFGGGAGLLAVQAIGVVAAFVWSFGTSCLIFASLKYTIGLRVSEREEMEGLDIHEHGMLGYPAPWVADNSPAGVSTVSSPAMAAKPALVS